MRIVLINGSPKVNGSASGILLEDFRKKVTEAGYPGKKNGEAAGAAAETDTEAETGRTVFSQIEIAETGLHTASVSGEAMKELDCADVWVFAYPLYVDGIPSQLLSCLVQLEKTPVFNRKKVVYGIVNCGFYEGIQAETALAVLENWCKKAGHSWGGGIGVGGGGALAMLPDMAPGRGPKAQIDKALTALAERCRAGTVMEKGARENIYVSVAMPRTLYKMAGQLGWRQMIKKNGGKTKDLSKRWEQEAE